MSAPGDSFWDTSISPQTIQFDHIFSLLAGERGFEPRLTDSESAVLPLDDSPVLQLFFFLICRCFLLDYFLRYLRRHFFIMTMFYGKSAAPLGYGAQVNSIALNFG